MRFSSPLDQRNALVVPVHQQGNADRSQWYNEVIQIVVARLGLNLKMAYV